MYHISQHINSTNHKIDSYGQRIKGTMNLGSKTGDWNDDSSNKLTGIQNYLLLIIVDTPKKDLSHGVGKLLTRRVHTSSIKYYSLFFHVQYVLCIIEFILIKTNFSC